MKEKRAAMFVIAGWAVVFIAQLIGVPWKEWFYVDLVCKYVTIIVAAILCAGSSKKHGIMIIGIAFVVLTQVYWIILHQVGLFSDFYIKIIDLEMQFSSALGSGNEIPFIRSAISYLEEIGLVLLFLAFIRVYTGSNKKIALGGLAVYALRIGLLVIEDLSLADFPGVMLRCLSLVAIVLVYLPKSLEK